MRKFYLLLLTVAMVAVAGSASAQDKYGRFRPKYRNLSYGNQHMTLTNSYNDNLVFDGKGMGFGFTTGRTYIVHPQPILGMLRFGIDATWFDVNYSKTEANLGMLQMGDYDLGRDNSAQMLEIAMQVGVSANINPVDYLNVSAYFRYAPTAQGAIDNANHIIFGNYANYYVTGLAVSWKAISLGCEYRFGSANHKKYLEWNADAEFDLSKLFDGWGGSGEGDGDGGDGISVDDFIRRVDDNPIKSKLSGWRAYISFRF